MVPLPSTGFYSTLSWALPTRILDGALDSALLAYGNQTFALSGLLLTFGLLWRVIGEKWAVARGVKQWPDYGTHIAVLVGYSALLAAYTPFIRVCIVMVGNLAQGFIEPDALNEALYARGQALEAAKPSMPHGIIGWGLNSVILGTLGLLGPFLYALVNWAVWSLRVLQTYLLAVIVVYGPIALSFSYLGGIFSILGVSWFWALIEISAWGITLDILNFVMTPLVKMRPDKFLLFNEFAICSVLLMLVRAVPQVTSMLIRGASGAIPSSGAGGASVQHAAREVRQVCRTIMRIAAKK